MVGLVAGHTMQKEVFVYSLTLWVVAILGFITTFHRMIHTIKQL
jgi:CDP-diacylglycerol--glycerol-3-phosphate 3-phosphatidyltransferase